MLRTFLFVSLITVAAAATSQAQVMVSLDGAGNSNVDLGAPGPNQAIDFYISKMPGSSVNAISGAVPDYEFNAAVVIGTMFGIAPAGSTDSGSGRYGDGNLQTSEFRRDSDTEFGINQEFDDPQPLTEIPQLWFSFDIDTTGLADGDYIIDLTDPNNSFLLFDGSTISFFSANDNLSFTVNSTAIPEPGSLGMLVVFGMLATTARRRRRC